MFRSSSIKHLKHAVEPEQKSELRQNSQPVTLSSDKGKYQSANNDSQPCPKSSGTAPPKTGSPSGTGLYLADALLCAVRCSPCSGPEYQSHIWLSLSPRCTVPQKAAYYSMLNVTFYFLLCWCCDRRWYSRLIIPPKRFTFRGCCGCQWNSPRTEESTIQYFPHNRRIDISPPSSYRGPWRLEDTPSGLGMRFLASQRFIPRLLDWAAAVCPVVNDWWLTLA